MTKRIRILILAVTLIAGLALPFGVAALQDIFGTHVWQVDDDAHYEYSGTLRNRAIALNAYRNGATNITAVITEQSDEIVQSRLNSRGSNRIKCAVEISYYPA